MVRASPDNPAIRLLVVEDDPDTAALVTETLEDHFGPGCVVHCDSIASALRQDVMKIDMVLSDMNLPDGSGLTLIDQLLARRRDLPIVFVTGEGILQNAMDAIRRGAYDYIVKAGDYLFAIPVMVEKNMAIWHTKQLNERLQQQLTRTLEQVRIKNQQLEEAVHKLQTMAATDPLTGLSNRRAFGDAMERCFAEATRYSRDLACIMIDLDEFKQLNDTLGHQQGDELLQLTGRVLEANCRRADIAGRFGGDEFIVVLPETDVHTASLVAQRIKDEFQTAVLAKFGDASVARQVTMSMGLATLRQSRPTNPEQLIAQADHALYRAKQSGKTRLAIHESATAPSIAASTTNARTA